MTSKISAVQNNDVDCAFKAYFLPHRTLRCSKKKDRVLSAVAAVMGG